MALEKDAGSSPVGHPLKFRIGKLDSSLNEDKTKLYDWDRGLFIKGDYTLVEDARREALDKVEAAAQDEDIVQKAQNNAEDSIREFLSSLGYQDVVFT